MQQVLLGFLVLRSGDTAKIKRLKGEDGQFCRLLRFMDGTADDIYNEEGNPSESPWVKRLRSAVQRAVEHDIPNYNLYGLRRASTSV